MSAPASRRGFLRGLTTLPLIGGGVVLTGNPTAVAQPASRKALGCYLEWLRVERGLLGEEMGLDVWDGSAPVLPGFGQAHRFHRAFASQKACRVHAISPACGVDSIVTVVATEALVSGMTRAALPSTRAALVLSAVGVDWRRA